MLNGFIIAIMSIVPLRQCRLHSRHVRYIELQQLAVAASVFSASA